MVSLKNIITHILQLHDYDVYEVDGILNGQKMGQSVSVGIFDEITVAELREHSRKVKENNGINIVCVLKSDDRLEAEASKLGLTLWRKSDLEAELGNMIVTHMGENCESSFSQLVGDKGASAEKPEIIIESIGNEGKPFVIKSNIDLEDVKEISAKTIGGFKYELEYVPHYLFQYRCTYQDKDGQTIQDKGTVSVNALTGKYDEWTNKLEFESSTEHIIQLEPRIDRENAQKIAIHAIITLHTEFKEIIIERDHATIIEKATFKPEADSIVLEEEIIVMVPVWCAEGKNGVMILDGILGKVISEDYYDSH